MNRMTTDEVQAELDKILDCANQVQYSINNFYKLVKRELPLRPLVNLNRSSDEKHWQCPSCDSEYTTDPDYNYDYCPNCGQRIDWR